MVGVIEKWSYFQVLYHADNELDVIVFHGLIFGASAGFKLNGNFFGFNLIEVVIIEEKFEQFITDFFLELYINNFLFIQT
jgi:hypothetical protein